MTVETACAHCGRPIRMTLTGEMTITVDSQSANPLVFMPDVDWDSFAEPTIVNAY